MGQDFRAPDADYFRISEDGDADYQNRDEREDREDGEVGE